MTTPIRRLSEDMVNRIAAGEVVERPASVVKELVENAIDAGATRIEVATAGGGASLIRVSDDGGGMGRDDLLLAVERHCTSKLDGGLDDIRSLGFRGEALAAIGAAARLTVTSRLRGAGEAWSIAVDGGRVGSPEPAALSDGTRIEVRDLFFATPARLKFLKSERAESSAITDVVRRLAIAHPHIRFAVSGSDRTRARLRRDERRRGAPSPPRRRDGPRLRRQCDCASTPRARARTLSGFAGLPTYSRANSLGQFLFVNGRPVRDKLLLGALRAAYADLMKRDRHPVAALFIAVPPSEVDVNVHPTKADVRFRDSGMVRGLIIGAIREAFAASGPRTSSTAASATIAAFRPLGRGPLRPPTAAWRPAPSYAPGRAAAATAADFGFAEEGQAAFDIAVPSADLRAATAPSAEAVAQPLGAAVAQVHDTYVVAQTADGLVVVDQHAAHERLVYERLKRGMAENGVASQILLIPEIVDLAPDDVARLVERADEFEALGLAVEAFGPGAVAVRETPAMLGAIDAGALVRDLAEEIAEWERADTLLGRLDAVASRMACHGSVRAGRRLKPEEMDALLREIEATPNASECNHGRPTFIELKLADIERLFGRR